MRFWSRFLYAGQKTFSASSRGWWGGIVEIGFATLLVLSGFLFLVGALAIQYLYSDSSSQGWHYTAGELAIRLGLASLALAIGFYRILMALWKVSTTVERREAMVSGAGETEHRGEPRPRLESLANLPKLRRPPVAGKRLAFRLPGRKRSLVWFVFTAVATLCALGIAVTLGMRFRHSLGENEFDYSALTMALFSLAVGIWAAIGFVRQAMRLSAFGPTILEISEFPLRPGEKVGVFLFQPGRFRFKLLEVLLVCEEVATYTQGTDIQTERRQVVQERLFRHRGVQVTPKAPFETQFEFELPPGAMHSFSSSNNQIQWKIVVQTLAKGWPQFEQVFPVVVSPVRRIDLPPSRDTPYASTSTT